MSELYATQANQFTGLKVRASTLEAGSQLLSAIIVIALSVVCFSFSTLFGVAATFSMTLLLCLMLPAASPALLITAFMFQNMTIAIFLPLMGDGAVFDAVRGMNFVALMTVLGACLLAAFLHSERLPAPTKRWLRIIMVMLGVVIFYLALGVVRGDPKDAMIYFRNTLTPLACFAIGITAASLYKIQVRQYLLWLGLAAIGYGYCELFFAFDFLALFNGDDYFRLRLVGQIESGYWDRILLQTGFVLRGLDDVMMVPFLNMAFFNDYLPQVFRLSGPNVHPISFAYALSVISCWMLFSKRSWFAVLAFPLLLIIGSKGALILLISAVAMNIGIRLVGVRITVVSYFLVLFIYLVGAVLFGKASGDYHVLGLMAGIRDFLHNPLGQGLGFGGNLSSSIKTVLSWSRAQEQGIADIPVESALGVMLFQIGIGAIGYFFVLFAIARANLRLFLMTGSKTFLFGLTAICTICANAVLQEEAIYSPLALGFVLLLVGINMGEYWRQNSIEIKR